jgi:S1-C subfamily serine protease
MFSSIRHFKKTKALSIWIAAGSLMISGLAPLPVLALTLDQGIPPVQLSANSAAIGLQDAFIEVAAKVSPAVVNIGSEWTEDVQAYGGMNDLFNFFYGQHGMGQQQGPVFKRKQQALGSGFLVTSDGYI